MDQTYIPTTRSTKLQTMEGWLSLVSNLLPIVAILVALIWLKSRQEKRNLPPGLPSLPIVGSIPFLGLKGEDDHLRYTYLAKNYGRVYSFWIANK